MNDLKYQFGSIVVVDGVYVGVVVKMWADKTYDVYVRSHNAVFLYPEDRMENYVFDKELVGEE